MSKAESTHLLFAPEKIECRFHISVLSDGEIHGQTEAPDQKRNRNLLS